MAIYIQLPAEIEIRLRAKAAQLGQSLEGYLREIASQEAMTGNGSFGHTHPALTPQDRATLWHAWATSHRPLATFALDSRETIYAGRGE